MSSLLDDLNKVYRDVSTLEDVDRHTLVDFDSCIMRVTKLEKENERYLLELKQK